MAITCPSVASVASAASAAELILQHADFIPGSLGFIQYAFGQVSEEEARLYCHSPADHDTIEWLYRISLTTNNP